MLQKQCETETWKKSILDSLKFNYLLQYCEVLQVVLVSSGSIWNLVTKEIISFLDKASVSIWLVGISTVGIRTVSAQKIHTKNRWNLHTYTTYLQLFNNK